MNGRTQPATVAPTWDMGRKSRIIRSAGTDPTRNMRIATRRLTAMMSPDVTGRTALNAGIVYRSVAQGWVLPTEAPAAADITTGQRTTLPTNSTAVMSGGSHQPQQADARET